MTVNPYISALEPLFNQKLDEYALTEGERNFMKGLFDSQVGAALDIFYPVHPTEDVALELGISKRQGSGYVSSLLKKGLIIQDEDLILQNIVSSDEEAGVLR